MKPLASFKHAAKTEIKGVFADIDDTMTSNGRLHATAYSAMQRWLEHGKLMIPITGRPAGWCDLIARLWSVSAVVGENGAFYYYYDPQAGRLIKVYRDDQTTRSHNRQRLASVKLQILEQVPGCALASDQRYRESDLAIDFCEDVAPLDDAAVAHIVTIMQQHGMTAKVSSIHVNGWFGDYSKLGMTQRLMRDVFKVDLTTENSNFVYIGDSPNDEPMFEFFEHSVGVANIAAFVPQLRTKPTYITQAEGGIGFSEMIDQLLETENLN